MPQTIAVTAPTLFFAAMKNIGVAENVLSVTQTTGGVAENPCCDMKGLAFAKNRFVG
jgi:hypothetical protein